MGQEHQPAVAKIEDIFPCMHEYRLLSGHATGPPEYVHLVTKKNVQARHYSFCPSAKASIEAYYSRRQRKLPDNPHVLQLVNYKIVEAQASTNSHPSTLTQSNLCSLNNRYWRSGGQTAQLWVLAETESYCLEDQITSRANKKPFQEIQIWSVVSSCVLGAISLIEQGLKQPVLSPKGIKLSKDGVIKVGEWELVSSLARELYAETGEIVLSELGALTGNSHSSALNELLTSYYWGPQGLKPMETFTNLGQLQTYPEPVSGQNPRFQVFSLGLTIISMCLRSTPYRTDTFSERYLEKLISQAIQIRKLEGRELSPSLLELVIRMVKWAPEDRITYYELRDQIVEHFSKYSLNGSTSLKSQSKNSVFPGNPANTIRSNTDSRSLESLSDQSFVDTEMFALAEQKIRQRDHRKLLHHLSSEAGNSFEGSGVVEQGTGDNEQVLEDDLDYASKSKLRKSSRNAVYLNDENKCPNHSPFEPLAKELEPGRSCSARSSMNNINNKKYLQTIPSARQNDASFVQDSESEITQHPKQNAWTKPVDISNEQSQSLSSFYLNNTLSRGSYRCSHKQRPLIYSARVPANPSQGENEKFAPKDNHIKHEFIIRYARGQPSILVPSSQDTEDQPDDGLSYAYFAGCIELNEEKQSPDIFESFDMLSEISNENLGISSQVHLEETFLGESQVSQSQPAADFRKKVPEAGRDEPNFMTFNEDNELEARFNRIDISPREPCIIMHEGQSLFTDPKLLEYIRSPLNRTTSPIHTQGSPQGQENISSNITSFFKSPHEKPAAKTRPESQAGQGQSRRIVKQTVSKGYYEGEKVNGMRSGYGVFYYKQGGKYRGTWRNNQMHGRGTLEYADGRVAYEGQWHCDELHGKGVLYNQSPRCISEGLDYRNLDELDEFWVLYDGEFEHDDKCGRGMLLLSNQEKFEGEFRDDMADGYGEYYNVEGETIKGIWSRNQLMQVLSKNA